LAAETVCIAFYAVAVTSRSGQKSQTTTKNGAATKRTKST